MRRAAVAAVEFAMDAVVVAAAAAVDTSCQFEDTWTLVVEAFHHPKTFFFVKDLYDLSAGSLQSSDDVCHAPSQTTII